MAIKATIFKASLQIADIDRGVYVSQNETLARHPSETDERMMVRLLALALNVPPDPDHEGALQFAKGMWDPDEPELWQKDLTGRIVHWIEVGQPDDRRLMKAAGKADRVSVYSYSASTSIWWGGIASKVTRARNIEAWQIAAADSQALAAMAARGMQLQLTVQDGTVYVTESERSAALTPQRLNGA